MQDCGDQICAFHAHVRNCGGNFEKTKEPEKNPSNKRKKISNNQKLITNFLGDSQTHNKGMSSQVIFDGNIFGDTKNPESGSEANAAGNKSDSDKTSIPQKCGEAAAQRKAGQSETIVIDLADTDATLQSKKDAVNSRSVLLQCPICWNSFGSNLELNNHLDKCLVIQY
eukprot:EC095162.1.p3 GENE.EC095162.1~~EC095162.1.p3  ORF type:complete len:169 (+),score=7.30 EC095162.1:1-507(+)